MKRRAFLSRTVGLTAGVGCLALAGMARGSEASPVQGHRMLDMELFDAKRRRPVPVRLYVPQQARPSQAVPLVVFSHGLGGSRSGYRYLGSHWADQGMASLHPQHTGSDNEIWRGNPLTLVQRLQSAASDSEAQARVLDLRFALDQVLASEWAPLLDASKVAVAGHSYGANTAMLASGARVTTANGEATELQDVRIRAAILISAPPVLGQGPAETVLGTVTIPTLHITSLEDTINLPGFRSGVEDRIAIFRAMSRSPRTLAVFNTGGHSIFTDRITRSGPETSGRIKSATRELCTMFLQQSLMQGNRVKGKEGLATAATVDPLSSGQVNTSEWHPDFEQWRHQYQDLLDQFILPGTGAVAQQRQSEQTV